MHYSKFRRSTSEMDRKRILKRLYPMSALPPKADIAGRQFDARFALKTLGFHVTSSRIVWSGQLIRRCDYSFLTGNSKDDYRDYQQPKKISLPCCSERNWIRNSGRTGHSIHPVCIVCVCAFRGLCVGRFAQASNP